jgi:magnesium transporter
MYAHNRQHITTNFAALAYGDSMDGTTVLKDIREHIETVIAQDSSLGIYLWNEFIKLHPADIAQFLADIEEKYFKGLFQKLPGELKMAVFDELSAPSQIEAIEAMDEQSKADALNRLPADALTDLFELLSDDDLKKYLEILNKKAREEVLSLMQFHPESVGGIMDTDIFTLQEDFTVEKSISILQRLVPDREIHHHIYITNRGHQLKGYIKLEDLVLQRPHNRISSFLHKAELVARPEQDREEIVNKMVHYSLMSVPVVDSEDRLLGVIQSDRLAEVLMEEAGEDVQKMSAVQPLKYPYFETPFFRIFYQRSYILLALFVTQSFSSTIMQAYEATLRYGVLLYFTTMLISTGGNASNQTSAVAIQGMLTGDINTSNIKRFIRREMLMALALSSLLGVAAFIRSYLFIEHRSGTNHVMQSLAIAVSQALIVFVSVSIGSCVPALLRRLHIDPAFAAGPMLATLMDVIGIFIFCLVTKFLLF